MPCKEFSYEKDKDYRHHKILLLLERKRNLKKGKVTDIFKATQEYVKSNVNLSKENVLKLSDLFCHKNLLSKDNKNAIVAASKLLWVYDHEIIIVDSKNKNALGNEFKKLKRGCKNEMEDNLKFCDFWKEKFAEHENEIDTLCKQYNIYELPDGNMFKKAWFKKRIFDMYLVNIG